jgi:hypothetical protein
MEEIQYFFSYSRQDSEFVLKLAKELRAVGVNLWVDQLDIIAGERWDQTVEKALRACGGMIAVLSPESLASNNVMDEVSFALERGKLILPVLVRTCEIPFRLLRVQRADFTVNYDMGYSQLLRALRIELPAASIEPPEPEQLVTQELKDPLAKAPIVGKRDPPKKPTTQSAPVKPFLPVKMVKDEQPPVPPQVSEVERRRDQGLKESTVRTRTVAETEPPKEQTTQPTAIQLSPPDFLEPKPSTRKPTRRRCAIVGFILGLVLGTIALVVLQVTVGRALDASITSLLICGVGGAIIGSVSGGHRRVLLMALVGAFPGFCLAGWRQLLSEQKYALSRDIIESSIRAASNMPALPPNQPQWGAVLFYAIVLGIPIGGILGVSIGAVLKNRLKWQ